MPVMPAEARGHFGYSELVFLVFVESNVTGWHCELSPPPGCNFWACSSDEFSPGQQQLLNRFKSISDRFRSLFQRA